QVLAAHAGGIRDALRLEEGALQGFQRADVRPRRARAHRQRHPRAREVRVALLQDETLVHQLPEQALREYDDVPDLAALQAIRDRILARADGGRGRDDRALRDARELRLEREMRRGDGPGAPYTRLAP